MNRTAIVNRPGTLALIQDQGRYGYRNIGVATSGSFDSRSANAANHLVGNDVDKAVVEVLMGGTELTFSHDSLLAITGALVSVEIESGGRYTSQTNRPIEVKAGSHIRIGMATEGIRSYLATRGGFQSTDVLGSLSSDQLSGLGPKPLEAGDVIPIGSEDPHPRESAKTSRLGDLANRELTHTLIEAMKANPASTRDASTVLTLPLLPSPHSHLVLGKGIEAELKRRTWTVSPSSSRIGIRLEGKALPIEFPSPWPSEPTVVGSLQATPSGELIVFGPDSPTTGGYPAIGVFSRETIDIFGQLRPGSQLKLKLKPYHY